MRTLTTDSSLFASHFFLSISHCRMPGVLGA
jgi:hypothetical protein